MSSGTIGPIGVYRFMISRLEHGKIGIALGIKLEDKSQDLLLSDCIAIHRLGVISSKRCVPQSDPK